MKRPQKLYKVYRCQWTKDGQVHRTEKYFAKDFIVKLDKTPPPIGYGNSWFEPYKYKWYDFHHLRFLWSGLSSWFKSSIAKRKFSTLNKIMATIIMLGTFAITVLSYLDQKTIERLEIEKAKIQFEKSNLQSTVDSLTKEIEALKTPHIVMPSDSSTATET